MFLARRSALRNIGIGRFQSSSLTPSTYRNLSTSRFLLFNNKGNFNAFRFIKTKSFFQNYGKRFNSTSTTSTSKKTTGIKQLIQEYGYSALGIYFAISMVDFPICFLVVHSAGEDKIKEFQDSVLTWIGLSRWASKKDTTGDDGEASTSEKEGEEESSGYSTLWTELAVAYAIHKSLIFIRLPITAAITPAVVNKLRSMGFNVGKLASAASKSVSQGSLRKSGSAVIAKDTGKDIKDASGLNNPKFGKPVNKAQKWFFF